MIACLVVFVAMFLADVCWTKYFIEVANKAPVKAAAWSAAIVGCGALSVTSYVADHVLIIPALAGSFVGTYVTVRREGKK